MDAIHTGAIVAGFDGSSRSRCAVDWAAHEAQARKCDLLVVHAIEPLVIPAPYGYPTAEIDNAEAVAAASQHLKRLLAACQQAAPTVNMTGRCEQTTAARALADAATQVAASLLVLGAPEHGTISRLVLGSTADQLIGTLEVPIVVCGDHLGHREGVVLVGADDAENSQRTRAFASTYARLHNATVNVVPDRILLEESRQARLVVAAAERHTAIQHALRGSASRSELYQGHCPVALVRS